MIKSCDNCIIQFEMFLLAYAYCLIIINILVALYFTVLSLMM